MQHVKESVSTLFQSAFLISQHPYLTALHFWVSLLRQRLNLLCSVMTLAGSLNLVFNCKAWSVCPQQDAACC